MRTEHEDALRKAAMRDAWVYLGFAAVLLVLLVTMLWMSALARLSKVEFYVAATVLAGSVCVFRAAIAWRQSKGPRPRREQVKKEKDAVVGKAARTPSARVPWAKRIHEDS